MVLQNIFSTLARRAYRRPATERDVSVLMDLYGDVEALSACDLTNFVEHLGGANVVLFAGQLARPVVERASSARSSWAMKVSDRRG